MKVEKDMREPGTYTAGEIEKQVREMAEIVFHVIAKDPQEEHVASNVSEAAVQEHACENGEERSFEAPVATEKTADVRGDSGVGHDEGIPLMPCQGALIEEDDDIGQNEHRVDDRVGPAWVQIFERDEHSLV